MTLLERALAKQGRATVDDVLGYVAQFGPAIRVVTPQALYSGDEALQILLTAGAETEAIAILTAPVPGLGENVCGLVAIGIGRQVDGRVFAKRIATVARAWGAHAVMAATHRHAGAVVRKYGGAVDSTLIRWELR